MKMGTGVRGILGALLIAALAAVSSWLWIAGGIAAEENLTPEFRQAMRLFLKDSPSDRAKGEGLILSMGERAVPQLKSWILKSEGDLERARDLLFRLMGRADGINEELVAARPFLSSAISKAWSQYHGGEYREAQHTAEAVLQLDPESPELWRARRLIRQCQDRLITKELLEPTVEFSSQFYSVDDAPCIHFRLFNRSQTPIYVRADRGILGSLELVIERRFFDGSELMDQRTRAIRTEGEEEEIIIEPRSKYQREIAIFVEPPKPPQGMVMRIRAGGKFQPAQWEVGEKNITRVMNLPSTECWVVSPKERPLVEAPIRKLQSALIFRDLHSFFTAGSLAAWAGEGDPLLNENLLKVLIENLPEMDVTGIQVADSLLEKASGKKRERKGESPEEISRYWRTWWKERKENESSSKNTSNLIPRFLNR